MCQDFSFRYITIAERHFIFLGLLLSWVAKLKSASIKHTCDSLQLVTAHSNPKRHKGRTLCLYTTGSALGNFRGSRGSRGLGNPVRCGPAQNLFAASTPPHAFRRDSSHHKNRAPEGWDSSNRRDYLLIRCWVEIP